MRDATASLEMPYHAGLHRYSFSIGLNQTIM